MPRRMAAPLLGMLAVLAIAGALGCTIGADSASPTPDLPPPSERFRSPGSLESYRWSMDIEAAASLLQTGDAPAGLGLEDAVLAMRIEGARVNPDHEWTLARTTFGYLSLERETVVIEGRLWSRQENGAWRERATLSAPEDFIGQDVGLSPAVLLGNDDPALLQRVTDDLMARPFTVERLGGMDTWHWVLDREWLDATYGDQENPIPGLAGPEEVSVEVWTDQATGVAVRVILLAGSREQPDGFRLEMNLFDLNDPSVEVEEPVGAISR